MTKTSVLLSLLVAPTIAWSPNFFPKNLRPEERMWRSPDPTMIRRVDNGLVGTPRGNYMDEMLVQPEPATQLRRSDAVARDDYMMEMTIQPTQAELRHTGESAAYQDAERLWGLPPPPHKPLTDNVMIAPRLRDKERTWRFPKANQIVPSEVHVGPHFGSPVGVADEHVKTLLFETKKHLPDWVEEDVTQVLSEMEENSDDFQPPEVKEKVTSLFFRPQVHLPGTPQPRVVPDFDDMAPGPEYLE